MTGATDPRGLSRRAVLGMLVAGAAACTRLPVLERAEPSPSPGQRPPRSSAGNGGNSAAEPGAAEPGGDRTEGISPAAGRPYEPLAAEPLPNVKRVAARFVEALLTYGVGASSPDVVAGALEQRRGTVVAEIVDRAAPLFVPGAASAGTVVYPQFGGLQPLGPGATRASIIVVVEQRLRLDSGQERRVVRTMDVRVSVDDGRWRVRGLRSAGGSEVRRPRILPSAAEEVLDHGRVDLPDTARWDIHRGLIDRRVLRLMSRAADERRISVAVLRTGHPRNVFGVPGSISSHTLGRAVDVWAVGGVPVVQQQAQGTPTYQLVGRLLDDPRAAQVGSPFDRDPPPPRSRSFTDLVHSDHIHIAIPQRG